MNRIEKIERIQELLANEAGKHLSYKSWSDEFCRKDLRELRDKIIEQIGRVSLEGLTKEEADRAAFGKWDEVSNLRLAPVWLYPFLHPGDELESISENKKVVGENYTEAETANGVRNAGYIDNDNRFGCLAYGVRVTK